jgi:hypothetical protein
MSSHPGILSSLALLAAALVTMSLSAYVLSPALALEIFATMLQRGLEDRV